MNKYKFMENILKVLFKWGKEDEIICRKRDKKILWKKG